MKNQLKTLNIIFVFFFVSEIDLHNVQDAFVIAVEPQARRRLEKLAELYKIQPVDMAQLCQQVCYPFFSLYVEI